MALTLEQRRVNGRMGALKVHASGRTNTLPARQAFNARFEAEVDPEGVLPPAERAKRAEQARRLYYLQLAAKSAKVRRRSAS